MSDVTSFTALSVERPMTPAAGTHPHVHALSPLHARVVLTPLLFVASKFHVFVVLSDEILGQQQFVVNFKVLHAANESLPTQGVGQVFLWHSSNIELLEEAGVEKDQVVLTQSLYLASFLTVWPCNSHDQPFVHGHSHVIPSPVIDRARMGDLQDPC